MSLTAIPHFLFNPTDDTMKKFFFLFLLVFPWTSHGCTPPSPLSSEDSTRLKQFFAYATRNNIAKLPVNERIVTIGSFFMSTPYEGGTLEGNSKEQLVVNLRAFDCVTFVDNVLALARLPHYDEKSINSFLKNLQQIRYREGRIIDYTSRLHYSTDWLHEMIRTGIVTDVTLANGGISFTNKVDFISRNHSKYPVLKRDSSLVSKMIDIERNINSREYYYIPKNRVASIIDYIQEGDIILITTDKKGLDTAHVGIAIRKSGQIYLLHASVTAKKVTITEMPLPSYLEGIPSHSGIMIARPIIFKSN